MIKFKNQSGATIDDIAKLDNDQLYNAVAQMYERVIGAGLAKWDDPEQKMQFMQSALSMAKEAAKRLAAQNNMEAKEYGIPKAPRANPLFPSSERMLLGGTERTLFGVMEQMQNEFFEKDMIKEQDVLRHSQWRAGKPYKRGNMTEPPYNTTVSFMRHASDMLADIRLPYSEAEMQQLIERMKQIKTSSELP
ncbi:MAG: hypothetical protein LBO78_01110 [Rickettsiales bacterium]|jgi:hypothetical protein|nr:hypothetical protein [Rickettsiales bacterium]